MWLCANDKMGVRKHMSSQWNYSDDDDRDDQGQADSQKPKGGMREYIKQLEARNKELETRLTEAEGKARTAALQNVVTEKKLNPKVVKLLPKDIEPTTDAIEKWLEEFGDVFNLKQPEPEADSQGEVEEQDPAEQEYRQQMGQISNAANNGRPPAREKDLLAKLTSRELTKADLEALITQQGGGYGAG